MYCMSNGIVNELKSHLSVLSGFAYITSLSVDSSEYYVTVAGKPMALYLSHISCTNSTTRQLKSAQMDCLLCYMVIKQALSIKQKVFTFKHSLNRRVYSSPGIISMRNSVIQALLTRTRLINECVIYNFTIMISLLFGGVITMPA